MKKKNIRGSINGLELGEVVTFKGDGYSICSVRAIAAVMGAESRKRKKFSVNLDCKNDAIKVTRVK
ncbi:MAG: hypothetical protein LBK58_00720 [Prevotellaceae bacterium]|nr:hypothetical protein [Prevotellaceae bacterium]